MVPDLAPCYQRTSSGRRQFKQAVISREIQINYPEKRIVQMYMVPIDAPVSDTTGGYVVVPQTSLKLKSILKKLSNTNAVTQSWDSQPVSPTNLETHSIHSPFIYSSFQRKLKDALKERTKKPSLNP